MSKFTGAYCSFLRCFDGLIDCDADILPFVRSCMPGEINEPSESSYQLLVYFYNKIHFFNFISSESVSEPCRWFHRSVRMILRWFAPQHSSKLHLSSEIHLVKDRREGQIPEPPRSRAEVKACSVKGDLGENLAQFLPERSEGLKIVLSRQEI